MSARAEKKLQHKVTKRISTAPVTTTPLHQQVLASVRQYFDELNGEQPSELYDLMLSQVERPLLEVVMEETGGNISRAAKYLGLNRATLRKKLSRYGMSKSR